MYTSIRDLCLPAIDENDDDPTDTSAAIPEPTEYSYDSD